MNGTKARIAAITAAAVLVVSFGASAPSEAKQKTAAINGLAAMHDIRKERGKLCFTDHYHYGTSDGRPSKKAAIRWAIVSWQDFTDLEYGGRWAKYRLASSKKVSCKVESGNWGCEVEARPCAR